MSQGCVFCGIVRGSEPASIICEDEQALAFVDLRQFHPGHVLVIPRQHVHDVRELDPITGGAVMAMISRIARAVSRAFPSQGMSVWHSIGEAAFQEVPHLHFHVHPRHLDDGMLRIYPNGPATPGKNILDSYAAEVQAHLV
jgi:histidine triad (HIT) family protein